MNILIYLLFSHNLMETMYKINSQMNSSEQLIKNVRERVCSVWLEKRRGHGQRRGRDGGDLGTWRRNSGRDELVGWWRRQIGAGIDKRWWWSGGAAWEIWLGSLGELEMVTVVWIAGGLDCRRGGQRRRAAAEVVMFAVILVKLQKLWLTGIGCDGGGGELVMNWKQRRQKWRPWWLVWSWDVMRWWSGGAQLGAAVVMVMEQRWWSGCIEEN